MRLTRYVRDHRHDNDNNLHCSWTGCVVRSSVAWPRRNSRSAAFGCEEIAFVVGLWVVVVVLLRESTGLELIVTVGESTGIRWIIRLLIWWIIEAARLLVIVPVEIVVIGISGLISVTGSVVRRVTAAWSALNGLEHQWHDATHMRSDSRIAEIRTAAVLFQNAVCNIVGVPERKLVLLEHISLIRTNPIDSWNNSSSLVGNVTSKFRFPWQPEIELTCRFRNCNSAHWEWWR